MEFDEVIRTTFAAREFTDDPVTDNALWDILDTARFAPSGGNRQGARVIVVREQKTKLALAELSKPGARRYLAQRVKGEKPWNVVTSSEVTAADLAAVAGVDEFVAPLTTAPVVLVVTVNLAVVASMDKDLGRIGVVSGGSIYPLVWNILTTARSRGYGGTITTMAVAEEPGIRELLSIPHSHAVAAVVPLGKPVKQLTRLRRVPVEEFVTRESFDGEAFER